MQPVSDPELANGSQVALKPGPDCARIALARETQPPPPCEITASAIEGLTPPLRKKLTRAAETQVGLSGSQGMLLPTNSGLELAVAPESGSDCAARQFATRASPWTALAWIGRFRRRPRLNS